MKLTLEIELHGSQQEALENTQAFLEHVKLTTAHQKISKNSMAGWGVLRAWKLVEESVR